MKYQPVTISACIHIHIDLVCMSQTHNTSYINNNSNNNNGKSYNRTSVRHMYIDYITSNVINGL